MHQYNRNYFPQDYTLAYVYAYKCMYICIYACFYVCMLISTYSSNGINVHTEINLFCIILATNGLVLVFDFSFLHFYFLLFLVFIQHSPLFHIQCHFPTLHIQHICTYVHSQINLRKENLLDRYGQSNKSFNGNGIQV